MTSHIPFTLFVWNTVYVTTGYTTRPASKPVDLVHNHATQLTRFKTGRQYNGNIAEHRSKTKLRSMRACGAFSLYKFVHSLNREQVQGETN